MCAGLCFGCFNNLSNNLFLHSLSMLVHRKRRRDALSLRMMCTFLMVQKIMWESWTLTSFFFSFLFIFYFFPLTFYWLFLLKYWSICLEVIVFCNPFCSLSLLILNFTSFIGSFGETTELMLNFFSLLH